MSSAPRLMSKPISSITPEQARNARAYAWLFVFDCFEKHQSKEGGPATNRPDNDAKEIENGCAANRQYT